MLANFSVVRRLLVSIALASACCGAAAGCTSLGSSQSNITAALPDPYTGSQTQQGPGLIPDTWVGFHAYQVFDGDVSDSQASADAHLYDMVWGSQKPTAWSSGNHLIDTSWYLPFDTDGTNLHTLAWWKKNHPDWVLYRCDERTPAWAGGVPNIPIDISNPTAVHWQLTTYAPVAESGGYSGIAADLVDLTNSGAGCGVFINGVWTARFNGQSTDPAWASAVIAWAADAQRYLHSLARPLQLGVNNVPEYRPAGDADETALISHADYINDESSFTDYGNSYASLSKFKSIVAWMQYVQSLNKPWIIVDKWNTQQLSTQELGWSLATYLMGKYHYAAMFTDHMPGYGKEYWHPEYGAAVGSPCGDMYPDPSYKGVYYRKYTGAFVIVNASNTAGFTVTLPKPSYTDIDGGSVTSPLLVPADTGRVLMTNRGCR